MSSSSSQARWLFCSHWWPQEPCRVKAQEIGSHWACGGDWPWLIAPRATIYPGSSYPALPQQCQDVVGANLLPCGRAAHCQRVRRWCSRESGARQQRARCSSMSAGALDARSGAYRQPQALMCSEASRMSTWWSPPTGPSTSWRLGPWRPEIDAAALTSDHSMSHCTCSSTNSASAAMSARARAKPWPWLPRQTGSIDVGRIAA